MSDYTPSTKEMRKLCLHPHYGLGEAEMGARFDRWLNSVKAGVWDEATRDAYDRLTYEDGTNPYREGRDR